LCIKEELRRGGSQPKHQANSGTLHRFVAVPRQSLEIGPFTTFAQERLIPGLIDIVSNGARQLGNGFAIRYHGEGSNGEVHRGGGNTGGSPCHPFDRAGAIATIHARYIKNQPFGSAHFAISSSTLHTPGATSSSSCVSV